MGFSRVYVAPNSGKGIKTTSLKIIELETLRDVIKSVFS
jgi:hypothetical protein